MTIDSFHKRLCWVAPQILLLAAVLGATVARSPAQTSSPAGQSLGDALDATNLEWSTGGDLPWFAQTNITMDGIDAVQAGATNAYYVSWIEAQIQGPGIVAFAYKYLLKNPTSEDLFSASLDGQPRLALNAITVWTNQYLLIPDGTNTVRWTYKKGWWPDSTDGAWLDQVVFPVAAAGAPQILGQPVSQDFAWGETGRLEVIATGTLPLFYQWLKDGVALTDATNAQCVIPAFSADQVGQYQVVVSNAFGTVTSQPASVGLVKNLVQFGTAETSVTEGGWYPVTLTRTGGTNALTVYFTIGGTATATLDYSTFLNSCAFGPNETSQYFNLYSLDDTIEEPTETIIISLAEHPAYQRGANATFTLNLFDNDPNINVTASVREASEAGLQPGEFLFTRTGDTSKPLTVYYALGGTATPGLDYRSLPGLVEFAPGQSQYRLKVELLDDAILEGRENVILTVLPHNGYYVGASAEASISLSDDEQPNQPPVVSLLQPQSDAIYPTPVAITLAAVASDRDGSVVRVKFYDGPNLLGEVRQAPYELHTQLAEGLHVLVATAIDDAGAQGESRPVYVRVGHQDPLVELVSAAIQDQALITGNGDSTSPSLTPDGQRVAFVSRANNLVTNDTRASNLGSWMDVFVRDTIQQRNLLVSVNRDGTAGGSGDSLAPLISTNGQFVLFESWASDLVNNDTNQAADVFLRDLTSNRTYLVSTSDSGEIGNGGSGNATMTPDGRRIVFESLASNLAPGDSNGARDIFLRDVQAETTRLVSVAATGAGSALAVSDSPIISEDGRWVAFVSSGTNLFDPSVVGKADVFTRDIERGQTHWASSNAVSLMRQAQAATGIRCLNPALSADGRYVAFKACPTNNAGPVLIVRHDQTTQESLLVGTNGVLNPTGAGDLSGPVMSPDGRWIVYEGYPPGTNTPTIFLWDAEVRTNRPVGPPENRGLVRCLAPKVSADGRYVSFIGQEVPRQVYQLYVCDTANDTLVLASHGPNHEPVAESDLAFAALSPNGRHLAYATRDRHLVLGDNNQAYDVFLYDRELDTNRLISVRDPAVQFRTGNQASYGQPGGVDLSGWLVAFSSLASNLVPGDNNGLSDVFLRDRFAGATALLSVNTNGSPANGASDSAVISADGRFVAFVSRATDLSPLDTNRTADVYLHDRALARNYLVSVGRNGFAPRTGESYGPVINADGRWVAFSSKASDLVTTNDSSNTEDLFLRDMQAETTRMIRPYGASYSSSPMMRAVQFVASTNIVLFPGGGVTNQQTSLYYVGRALSSTTNLWVYHLEERTNEWISSLNSWPAFSDDGHFVCFRSRTNGSDEILVYDAAVRRIISQRSAMLTGSPTKDATSVEAAITRDGKRVAFVSMNIFDVMRDLNRTNDIYLYDFDQNTRQLAVLNMQGNAAPNGPSYSPLLTPDGRYLVFKSLATDLVPGAPPGENLYLRDLQAGKNWLVCTRVSGRPFLGGDGRTLFFASAAADLTGGDQNNTADLFTYLILPSEIADTDQDGLADAWEMQFFGNLSRDGAGDFDLDGFTDGQEFMAGTDPANASFVLRAEIFPPSPGATILIRWPAIKDRHYCLQYARELGSDAWTDVGREFVAEGDWLSYVDSSPLEPQRYYRVLIVP